MIPFFAENVYICLMETKANHTEKMVKVPQKALLALVASNLKDRVLFPEKLAKAKEYMKKVEASNK